MVRKLYFELILKKLALFPQGASLGDISLAISNEIPKRTLQRYLASLVNENQIQTFGKGVLCRYKLIQQKDVPDPFRTRYRQFIKEVVPHVVRSAMDKKAAVDAIKKQALASIPASEQARFIELVENELRGLYIGNIQRFHIRPPEFEAWQKIWK